MILATYFASVTPHIIIFFVHLQVVWIEGTVPDLSGIIAEPRVGTVTCGHFNSILQGLIGQISPFSEFVYIYNIGIMMFAVVKI